MSFLQLPCYYYPTMAILLDDSERFITKLALMLDTELAYKSISDPILALQYIETYSRIASPIQMTIMETSTLSTKKNTMLQATFNLNNVYKEIYNANRFNEPSVIVVDYFMPNMNGLDFCRKLKNSPIKKIMLTGQADENLGIQAFNEGLIDKFILKNNPKFEINVSNAIAELQKRYISERSTSCLNNLASQALTCLKDPAFIQFFLDVCNKYNVVEYYLIQTTGSYLLLQYDGTPLWLIVMNDEVLDYYTTFAKSHNMTEDIVNSLSNKQKIPFFEVFEKSKLKNAACEPHLYHAKKFKGQQTYYYALVEQMPSFFQLPKDKILSYKDYLETAWPPN